MYITAVEEREIIDIVKKCKSKTFTDFDGVDMDVVKRVMAGISKPLTYICNLSFQTGTFPDQMIVAKVYLFTNQETNFTLQIIDQSHSFHNSQKF